MFFIKKDYILFYSIFWISLESSSLPSFSSIFLLISSSPLCKNQIIFLAHDKSPEVVFLTTFLPAGVLAPATHAIVVPMTNPISTLLNFFSNQGMNL